MMAGPFWGSIASGFFQGQDTAISREEEQIRLKEMKRQQAQDEKIRQNLGLGMEALAQLAPPPQAGPQAPPPGASSQPPPRPMPGQGPPPMPPGMMPPPPGGQGAGGSGIPAMGGGQFAGPPPKMGAPGGAPPLPPYQSPQPPPQMGPQGANGIGAPPMQPQGQQGAPDLRTLIMAIKQKNPGLDDETVFGIAQRFEPMLNQEGKMQLMMAQRQIQELRARAAEMQADAAQKRAATGAAGEERRQETAAGTNAFGAAKVDSLKAGAEAARARAKKLGGAGAGAGGFGGLSTSGEKVDPRIDFYAIQELGGNHEWKSGFRGKEGQALLAQVMKRVPILAQENGITPEEVGTASASRKALTTALRNVVNRSEAVDLFGAKLEKDLGALDKLLDKAAPTGPLFVNKPMNELRRQFNDPLLAQLDLQARQTGVEFERLITSGGLSQAQLHRGAQEDAKGLISGDFTPAKTRAVIKQIKVDVANAKGAAREARSNIQDELTGLGHGQGGGGTSQSGAAKSFKTEAEANAAAAAGQIKKGDRITIGGQSGVWQ